MGAGEPTVGRMGEVIGDTVHFDIVDKAGKDLSIPGTDMPAQYLLPPRSVVNLQDGAAVGEMGPDEHDAAVAVVSHVPQVASTLVAGRLASVAPEALGLAGQGVRDVTRIAASDPVLWTQILAGNAPAVAGVLESLRDDLDRVIAALRALETAGPAPSSAAAPGTRAVLAGVLEAGNVGRALVPGKHGAPPTPYALVEVIVPDEPGALARLLTDVGDAGVNLEELRIDHGLGQPFGLAEVAVLPAAAAPLTAALRERGWRLTGD